MCWFKKKIISVLYGNTMKKNIKVCILINNLGSGGAERQAVNISKMLCDNQCSVSIVTYRSGDFFSETLKECGITYKSLNCAKPLSALFKTKKEFIREEYDVVIAFLRSPILLACAASFTRRWKLIIRMGSASDRFFTSRIGKVLTWLANNADAIVCNSENEKRLWLSNSKIPSSKIHVIYNLHGDLQDVATIEEDDYQNDKIRIVIPASYSVVKNVAGVIKAVAMLNDTDKEKIEIHWYGHKEIALGDTSVYDAAVAEIEKNGLSRIVYLHEETKDIYSIMLKSDFVGLFSLYEGLPNAICEGLLLGKPIIMTRVSDYTVLVNGNGFVCDSSSEAIRNTLHDAISTSWEQRKEMGDISEQIAKKYLTYDRIQNAWRMLLL